MLVMQLEQLVQLVTLLDNVIVILDTQELNVINVIHHSIVRVVFVKVRNSTLLITFCNLHIVKIVFSLWL